MKFHFKYLAAFQQIIRSGKKKRIITWFWLKSFWMRLIGLIILCNMSNRNLMSFYTVNRYMCVLSTMVLNNLIDIDKDLNNMLSRSNVRYSCSNKLHQWGSHQVLHSTPQIGLKYEVYKISRNQYTPW